jgi:N-acetylmuramoyl-L-alanine amidase
MSHYHVCIDPGHGPGCANKSPDGSYEEQEFAMDLANRIAALLRSHGVQVTLTRSAQDYPSLRSRCQTANAIPNLALFVSIHSNAAGNHGWYQASGHMVFTSQEGKTAKRNQAAGSILKQWKDAKIPLRGNGLVHYGYTVLTGTVAPAILLEHGFHTNQEEVTLLKNEAYRDYLAEADCKGILTFLGLPWKWEANHRERVKQRFGLQDMTLDYLQAYRYADDLLRKLALRE